MDLEGNIALGTQGNQNYGAGYGNQSAPVVEIANDPHELNTLDEPVLVTLVTLNAHTNLYFSWI